MHRQYQLGITTTANALYENLFLHYGFHAKLHSDKGANFESKVIKKLCSIECVLKTRITPYHPMGNEMVERYSYSAKHDGDIERETEE